MSSYAGAAAPSAPPAPPKPTVPSFEILARTFAFREDARFTGLLSPAFFRSAADKHKLSFGGGKADTFNAEVTLWAWLSQVLSPSKSCVAAVARVLVLCCSLSRPLCSAGAGAYCKARPKLPEAFVRDLTCQLGQQVEGRVPAHWKWRGHSVRIADGSLVLLPDTPENLAQYPQQRSQKPGTSPTCMRLVVLLALATGALLGMEAGAYRGKGTGEMSLLEKMLVLFAAGDILLGDRYYCSYPLLALLRNSQVYGCFRLSMARQAAFHQGEKLGEDDYLQTWSKPATRPTWIAKDVWDALPATLEVRVLRVVVRQRGFRSSEVFIGTTLLDPLAYPKEEVGRLYFDRWNGELDIRSLKQTLGLKMLRCQTPEMVRTELWVHLLGYNLVRCEMAQAAWQKGLLPRQLSFSGAVQTLDAFRWLLGCSDKVSPEIGEALATALATHRVGNRPGRYEPREIKHRQRKYPELKKARTVRRQELLEGQGSAGDNASGPGGGAATNESVAGAAATAQAKTKKAKGRGKNRPSGR
jgi:hypothetical protein